MTLAEVLIPAVPVPTPGIVVQVCLGESPYDPVKVHQIYLDTHFRITGMETGMKFEYYDGTNWQEAAFYP